MTDAESPVAVGAAVASTYNKGNYTHSLHVRARFSLPFPSFRHGPGSSRVERGSFSVMDPTFI